MEGNGSNPVFGRVDRLLRFNEALPLWKGMASTRNTLSSGMVVRFNEALPLWKGMACQSLPLSQEQKSFNEALPLWKGMGDPHENTY